MAKAYTDIEQSRKLMEFLPIESADMYLEADDPSGESYSPHFGESFSISNNLFSFRKGLTIPCWSLAALLNVIPKPNLIQNSDGLWLVHSWIDSYPHSVGGYSNPVDACYDMIIKLHEQKLL